MIRVLVYGIDVGDVTYISNLHLGNIARRYKSLLKGLGVDVITVNIFPNADIKFAVGESLQEILRRLPKGWEPDFILIQGPEYIFLPRGLYDSEYPVVFVTCDYDYDILRSYHFFKIADCVVCFSDDSKEEVERLGARKSVKFPFWLSFEHQINVDEIKHPKNRKTDIFYSGNTNIRILREKAKILYHVAKYLSKSREISYEINSGYLPQDIYIEKLLNAKVSFTYHRRREIQRPEVILCGGVLLTNSKELEAIFKKDEDFFVYESPEELEGVLQMALEKINSEKYNHEERLKRISSILPFFHPANRIYELIHHVYNNLDQSLVFGRLRESKEEFFISDILATFQLVDIYSLPRTKKEEILSAAKEVIDNVEKFLVLTEDSPMKEIIRSYRAVIEFSSSGKREFVGNKNYILPINLSILELSRFNYHSSIELLEKTRKMLSSENVESVFLLNYPLIPSIIPPQFFQNVYFPEYRKVFPELTSSEILREENRRLIMSYIDFVLGCLFRDIYLPTEPKFLESLKFFDRAYEGFRNPRYILEKAVTLVKLGKFEIAAEQVPEDIWFEYFEIFFSLLMIEGRIDEKAVCALDVFISSDPDSVSVRDQGRELIREFRGRFTKGRAGKPKCAFIFEIEDDMISTSIFIQNVLRSVYPYSVFYAVTGNESIRERMRRIFPTDIVRLVRSYDEIESSFDVFTFISPGLFVHRGRDMFYAVLTYHLGADCIVSWGKNTGWSVISIRREIFEDIVRNGIMKLSDFVLCPLSPGVVLRGRPSRVSAQEEDGKLKIELKS